MEDLKIKKEILNKKADKTTADYAELLDISRKIDELKEEQEEAEERAETITRHALKTIKKLALAVNDEDIDSEAIERRTNRIFKLYDVHTSKTKQARDNLINYIQLLHDQKPKVQRKFKYDFLLREFFKKEGLTLTRGSGRKKLTKDDKGYEEAIDNAKPDLLYDIILNKLKGQIYKIKFNDNVYDMRYKKYLILLFDDIKKELKGTGRKTGEERADMIDPKIIINLYKLTRNNLKPSIREIINDIVRFIFKDDDLYDSQDVFNRLDDYINNINYDRFKTFQGPKFIINIVEAEISDDKFDSQRIKNLNNRIAFMDLPTRLEGETDEDYEEDIKSAIIKYLNLPLSYIEIEYEPDDGLYANENGDCLRVAIEEITGVEYHKDNLRGINEWMTKHDKYFGIYNTYGQLLGGYLDTNIKNNCDLDLIAFDNHAVSLSKGEIQKRKIGDKQRLTVSYEDIIKIYEVVRENKLIYKQNTYRLNKDFSEYMEADETVKICVYIDDKTKKLFKFIDLPYEINTFIMFSYVGNNEKKTIYKSGMKDYLSQVYDYEEETEDIYKRISHELTDIIEKVENEKHIKFNSFPFNYRTRIINTKYEKGKLYQSIDMKKAYKTAFKYVLGNGIYIYHNIPIKSYENIEELYGKDNLAFMFYVSNCQRLPNGYVLGKYYNAYKQNEPNATYEFYAIKHVLEDTEQFKYLLDILENTNKKDNFNYAHLFGYLISVPHDYPYNAHDFTGNIKAIKFKENKLCTLHLNMILRFNELMIRKILSIYKHLNILPSGYKIDALLYEDLTHDDTIYTDEQNKFIESLRLEESDIWHKMENYKAGNEHATKEENIFTPSVDYLFGCAGSGKTTKIIRNISIGGLVIVKNYMLLNEYTKHNIQCALYNQAIENYNYYSVNCLYIEEAGTYTNEELNLLLNVAANNNLNICLCGDYYQLLPIEGNGEKLLIQYTPHTYLYKNYRNSLDYCGDESFIISAIIRGVFTKKDKEKRDKLLKKYKDYIRIGYDEENKNDVVLRWYKQSAANCFNKHVETPYYMLNNFMNARPDYIDGIKGKRHILKRYNRDSLYTIDEIDKKYINCFINFNVISFYNTQGKTLNYINICDEEDYKAIIRDPRMFYVMISRIKE